MAAKIESVFPTYLYKGTFTSSAKFNRELNREILALEKIDDQGRAWSCKHYVGGYSSYPSYSHLHKTSPNFAELEARLAPHIKKFIRKLNWDLRKGKVRMTSCWVNAMAEATHHTLHLHPYSVLSGVYYVDVPKGSSVLKFEDPRMGLLMAAPPRKFSAPEREQNYLRVEPKAGAFVLFESWMRHEVPPHRAHKRRMSVSFNYEWV